MHDHSHDHADLLGASTFAVSAVQRLAVAFGALAVLWLCVAWALEWF